MSFYAMFCTFVWISAAPPTQQEIVAQALAARTGLTNEYHLKVTVTSYLSGIQGKDKDVSKVELWTKGARTRTDEFKPESTSDPRHVGVRSIHCRNCERQGYGLYTRTGTKGYGMGVQFFPLDHQGFNALDAFRLDWMRLGQLPNSLIAYTREPADSALHLASQQKGDMSEATHAGQKCYVLHLASSVNPEGFRKCYFCPAYGMNPVHVIDESPRDRSHQETTITYAKYPGADVWYPKTITHVRQRNGKESFRETVVVDEAELNTAVPDGVFTLAGLNLDFGQPVGLPDLKNPQDQPSWGKNGLDWENTSQKASIMAYNQKMQQQVASTPPPTPDVPQTSYRWLYYAGAGVLAALAAGIAVVLVRRHRARPT